MSKMEHASYFAESRAATIEKFKQEKALHEKRQALLEQIDKVLKK